MKQNTGHKLSNRLPAAAILLLGLLASCGNLLVPKASPPAESAASGDSAGNTGSILVSITFPNTDTGTSARTAMPAAPAYDGLNWSVSASDGTQTVQAQGAYPDLTISLAHEGTWTFTARAVNDAGYEIFYGQAIQEITHGNAAVTIVPGPGQAMQTGTGSIRLVIQVAAGAGVADVYYKLVPIGNTAGGGSSSITPLTGGGSGWTFSEPAIGAGTYLLYLYFTDSAGATVYTTAESVNVWNGMTTDQWVNTGARYLTEHNGETVFLLTQDIIESFKQTVGTTVYVSETGFAGADGVGSVIAPAATMRQAFAVLNGRDGTIIVDGNVAVTDEETITNNQSVTVRGADAGGVLTNTGGRVFTVQAGASLTLGAGITLTGTNDRGNGGAVYVNGGTFTMTGGTISGNTASNGGGVYVDAGGAFEMSGGTISGNTASNGGGGVYVDSGTFTASGAVQITENTGMSGGAASNVYLASGQTIAVGTGGLDPAASIGVGGDDTDGDGLIPVTDKAAANAQSIFTSDDTAYEILVPGGTAIYLFSETAAAAAGDVLYVGSDGSAAISSLTDAVNSANSSGGTITLLKDIDSTNDAFATGPITFSGTNVTLDLNGNRIDRSAQANGNVITVSGGSSLTLADSAGGGMITGGMITGGSIVPGGAVYVDADGTFTMSGGTISGNTASDVGGGVYVNTDGTFTMSGGEISGNTPVSGGGVYVDAGGTFTMSGGEISGNTARDGGGGVHIVNDGTFTMSGGEISGNTARDGGGVEVDGSGSTFTMENGTISGNTAQYGKGGGVHIVNDGTFTMSGGEISGNTAHYGGGVEVDRGSTFTMENGTISGNTTLYGYGGGVDIIVNDGVFEMSGGNITQDNKPEPVSPDKWYDKGLGSWTAGTVGGGVPRPACKRKDFPQSGLLQKKLPRTRGRNYLQNSSAAVLQ